MTIQPDGDGYILTTGRTFYANNGIIGLAPQLDEVYEGYDGMVFDASRHHYDEEEKWTEAERAELADFMIDLWTKFKLGGR